MVLNGIPISDEECIGDSLATINSAFQTLSTRLIVSTGVSSPTSTPMFVGQEYLDVVSTKFYKASALNSSSWVILN